MANVALQTRAQSPSYSEDHPTASLLQSSTSAVPSRPPRSLSRPPPTTINIDIEAVLQSTPRKRGSGGLALQARDSVAIRKRTLSTGAMSARAARHNARKANTALLQPSSKPSERSPSGSSRHRNRSHSPGGVSHSSRSQSPSSSSPSQSPTPITPGQPPLSGGPSFPERGRTHIPHDSQGTTTSAYPPSSSISARSLSPSPDRSPTPSPPRFPKKLPFQPTPITTSLDLDPDDVNARLRLLVNNSYFLPPAHAKPELSLSRPSTAESKGATSPSAFKDFFRVGKKKEKKYSEPSGYTSEGARHSPFGRPPRVTSDESPQLSSGSVGRHAGTRYGNGFFDLHSPDERTRNRVVVVRETLEDLPLHLPRAPLRAHTYNSVDTAYNDPTTHYDVPPPNHFPSFADLRLDAAGITGNVQVDQFVPPGEPWSPAPSSPNGSGMDPQERVWRRAILEQAVDLSLSSTGSEAGIPEAISFARGGRTSDESTGQSFSALGMMTPSSPKSPKNKRSWWGRRDKDIGDALRRPSTSSSLGARDVPRSSGSQRATHSLDVDVQSQHSVNRVRRDLMLGQRILPNVHAELEEYERELALREKDQAMGLPPSLRLRPLAHNGSISFSAPSTPNHGNGEDRLGTGTSTVLSPPPHRKGDKKRAASEDDVSREFIAGHSTIRKSLSSPLLSDLHETGVDVERPMPFPHESNESLIGVAAPSLVLQDPSGITSLVNSSTIDSLSSGSHYDDDDHHEFDGGVMIPNEHYHEDDSMSFEQWHPAHSSSVVGSARPSFDSFGAERVRSPEYHPRASSTFGYRRSNVSTSTPSPLREPSRGIEVDISGDPIEHLSMMGRTSPTPSGESPASSARGYASALDYNSARSEVHPIGRPTSPSVVSSHSTGARAESTFHSLASPNDSGIESEAPIEFFDSIQHDSFLEGQDGQDGSSDDSEDEVTPPVPDRTFAALSEPLLEPPPLSRKSLSLARPAPVFSTQFRNASQPQLPVSRKEALPPLDVTFRNMTAYDMLDRRKPVTNTPHSAPSTVSGGILSQLKGKPSKSPVKTTAPFLNIGKKRSGSPVVLPESTFELLRYPHGTTFSTTVSEADSGEASSRGFDAAKSQGSLLSMPGSDSASFQHVGSWPKPQDESRRKLDGMVVQHLEAERDRLRKIASAARSGVEGRSRY